MKLEAGKYYRARDGSVHGPIKTFGNAFQSSGFAWLQDGHFDDEPHERDLLTEVYVSDTPTPERKARRQFKVGDRVAAYDWHSRTTGTIEVLEEIEAQPQAKVRGRFFNVKQLRRIVKKKRQEYWVGECFLNEKNTPGFVKVRKVK